MNIVCGPEHDIRTVCIELPEEPKDIGIFVSGGLDSAILYFLLVQENINTGSKHTILPLTVSRKEGSKYFARAVVEYVQTYFNLPLQPPLDVGDNTLYEPTQVTSGIQDALKVGCDMVYLGLITQLPEHMIGWERPRIEESLMFKAPFNDVCKSHVVDIIHRLGQSGLYYLTHSCDHELGRCGHCNGCTERKWGFSQMNLLDPGLI